MAEVKKLNTGRGDVHNKRGKVRVALDLWHHCVVPRAAPDQNPAHPKAHKPAMAVKAEEKINQKQNHLMRVNIDSSLLINSRLRGWWRGHMGACGWIRKSSGSSSSGTPRPSEAAGQCRRWQQPKLATSCFGLLCDAFDEAMIETLSVNNFRSLPHTRFREKRKITFHCTCDLQIIFNL